MEEAAPNGPTAARTTSEEDTADLARGAGVNYLGYVARLGGRVPFLFLAGWLYGEARFGAFVFGITVVETAAAVALFGMKRSLFKFMSEAVTAGRSLYGPIVDGTALALGLGAALTAAVAAGSGFLAELFRMPSAAGPLQVLSPAILMIVVSDILLVAIRFTRQMRFEVYARSVAEPLTLTAAIVVAYWAGLRDLGLALGYVVSLAVAALASAIFFARVFSLRECLRRPPRPAEIRRIVAFSAPTAGYDLLDLLADKVDILLVSYFLPASSVGVYGMARQIATVAKKVRAGFDRILPAVFSECIEAKDVRRAGDQLATVSRWILSAQAPIVLLFLFYGDELLGLLGGGFAEGAAVLVLLMGAAAASGALGVSELPAVYLRPAVNVVMGALTLLLVAGACLWLIPALGPEGAALAVLLTYTLVNGLRIAINRRLFGIGMLRPAMLKPLAAALAAGGAVHAFQRALAPSTALDLALGLPLLFAVYLAVLYALRLEPADRVPLRRLRERLRPGADGPGPPPLTGVEPGGR